MNGRRSTYNGVNGNFGHGDQGSNIIVDVGGGVNGTLS